MQIDDITKAAQERLAALDAEAKPHEEALATINTERERLRLVVAAGSGERLYKVAPLSPPRVMDSIILTTPQWVPPRATADWLIDPMGTHITICGTTALTSATTIINGPAPDDVTRCPGLAPSFSLS
jgi:hypothetical protein